MAKRRIQIKYGDSRDGALAARPPPTIPLWQWFLVSIASGITVFWITNKMKGPTT